MSTKTRIIMAVAIGATFAFVGLAPFALMLVPNPRPVVVSDIATQMPGDYVRTGGLTYHVFPKAKQISTFPKDALVGAPDSVFIVKYRQLADLSAYTVRSFEGDRDIAVERDVSTPELLQLRPRSPLAAGQYYAIVARESIYGGEDYVYFAVSESGAAR